MRNGKQFVLRMMVSLWVVALWNQTCPAVERRQLVVSVNGQSCPDAQFSRIQEAVDASSPGDSIHICNGVYNEQVVIQKPLDVDGDSEAYLMPTNMIANAASLTNGEPLAGGIFVTGAENVNISGLTLDTIANGIHECAPRLFGILYQNASGVIDTVRIRNTKLSLSLNGCQSGTGIFVQSGNGGKSLVKIKNCPISGYQKNGITANEVGTVVHIHENIVTGTGPTSGAAQNGIQIGFGASGAITKNMVAGNVWSPCQIAATCQAVATDILVVQSDEVRVIDNTTLLGQIGIFMIGNKGIIGRNNAAFIKVLDGIRLEGNENRVLRNKIHDAEEADLFIQGNGNSVTENTFENAPIGVSKTKDSIGNRIENNEFINVPVHVQDPPSISLRHKIVPER
jgi:nitrous oxidase accessory protein NosD